MARDTKYGILITGDAKGAVQAINLTTKEVEQLDSVTTKTAASVKKNTDSVDRSFSSTAKTAAKMGAAVGLAAVALGGLILRKVIDATAEQDAAMAQLNATLTSTQGVAGKTASELAGTAASLQKVTTFGDEAIIGMQSLLLTFKDIKGDNFDRTTKAVLDMSTALNQDLKSSALLAGKALNDPVGGLSALSRAGIQFTDSQKETIKAMVEMGDKAGAQTIILQELESQFGGSAEAARNTLGGALTGLQNSFGDLFEATSESSAGMVASINTINATISSPDFQANIQTLIKGLLDIVNLAAKAAAGIAVLGTAIGENLASSIGGTAVDDIDRLNDQAAYLKKFLVEMERAGQQAGDSYKNLRAELDAVEGKIKTYNSLFGSGAKVVVDSQKYLNSYVDTLAKSAVATDKYNVVTGKAGATQEKFTLVVNKGATANKTATAETEKSNVVMLKSAATREKEAKTAQAQADAHKKVQDQIAKNAALFEKAHSELDAMTKATDDYIASLKFETEQTGRSAREQAIENDVRAAGTRITKAQEAEIRKASAAKYDAQTAANDLAKAEQDAAQATSRAWEDARSTLSNFFFEMARDGKNAFDTLVDGFKAMLAKMVAEAAANTIFLGIGAVFPGVASAAGATATGTGAISGGASLLSGGLSGLTGGITAGGQALYESIGNIASNAGLTGIGDKFYTKGLNTNLTSIGLDIGGGLLGSFAGNKVFGETSGIGGTLGGIAGSALIPIPGLGAAIGSFIGTGLEKALDKVFGQKNDGNNRGLSDFDLVTGSISARGVGKSFAQENVDAAQGLATQIKAFSDAIGGSTLKANISVGSRDGIQYGGQSFGRDAEKFLQTAFKDVVKSATDVSDKLKPLILGFDGTAEELSAFAQVLIALDKETGGVSDQLIALVDQFEGTAQEVLRFSTAIASIEQQAGINSVTKAIEDFNRVVPTAGEAYQTHTADLREQIRAFDGTANAAVNLATTLAENKTAAYDFALAIQSIGKSIKEIAEDQAASIRESVLTADELLKKRISERDSLNQVLSTLSDPEAVSKTAQRILELNQQVFNSLTDEQQLAQAETFAQLAENTNTVAQSILQQSLDGLKITQDDINARVSQMLQQAAQGQQDAAAAQQAAANTQQEAANVILEAANTLNASANRIQTQASEVAA